MSNFWWNPKPTFDVEYTRGKDGKWHFVLRHQRDVEAVSSVQGFHTKEEAVTAVEVLRDGFYIGDAEIKP